MNLREVKARSEDRILAMGGGINPHLSVLDATMPRESAEVADRVLAMHAILQIYFGAPTAYLSRWLKANNLEKSLSRREAYYLQMPEVGEEERQEIYWYIEALWAMMWAGGLLPDLPVDQPVGDQLAAMLPDLPVNEPADGFRSRFRLRPYDELIPMLDFYYRAHWYARDEEFEGRAAEGFEMDVILERRKALEWICDEEIADWDETPEDT